MQAVPADDEASGCIMVNAQLADFRVRGTRRRVGAIGVSEAFTETVRRTTPELARRIASGMQYGRGFEHVHVLACWRLSKERG